MTLYEFNQICLDSLVVYTMCGDEKICIFVQRGPHGNLPELFEDCEIRETWLEDGLVGVLI